jgi:GT2 family glycosyltransferase
VNNELLFILPTYGSFEYAQRCLESFVRTTPIGIYTVAILDDCSPGWWSVDFSKWTHCPKVIEHFNTHDGLTRSWNRGLEIAKAHNFKYTICGNSDLLFSTGWYQPLVEALDSGFDLVGPLSNAPGHAAWQNIQRYCRCKITDSLAYIDKIAECARRTTKSAIQCKYVNGFFMCARTSTWWSGAFNDELVFNPSFKLTGNETELQDRWQKLNRKIGYVPKSFIFHYRSVSRPQALSSKTSRGAFRHERARRRHRIR